MERIRLPGTDLEVSEICYGTAGIAPDYDFEAARELLDAYREQGGNFIDTAHVYSAWRLYGTAASERTVGEYVKRSGADDLVLATKGGHPQLDGYRDTDDWLAPYRLRADIDDSLGRLGVEAIDLYYLHRDDTARDVGSIVDYLNEEVDRGRIRHLGCSNWTVERIGAANRYAGAHGLKGFAVSQVAWSLAHKEPAEPEPRGTQTIYAGEQDVAFHRRTGMPLAPYNSTGRGYFSAESGGPDDFDNPISRERRDRARELADRKGATPTQIALAYLMHQDFPCIPITGTMNPEHLRENIAAAAVELTAEEREWLAGA